MTKFMLVIPFLLLQCTQGEKELWLSPVNTGDCVAPRIVAERTVTGKATTEDVYFFTDRCSEEDYFIGVNGIEHPMKKVSADPQAPHHFIGSFAGDGISVRVGQPRLLYKKYIPGEAETDDNILDAAYEVLVTVKKGGLERSFQGSLLYGR